MTVRLNPYISFRSGAREAGDFYQSVFGGTIERSTYGEYQMGDPSESDKIMHSMLTADNGLVLMVSDVPDAMEFSPDRNGTISLSGDDDTTLQGYWDKLTEGGTVTLPLEKSPWGDSFGQVTDRFGINWMVNITGAANR